MTDPFFERERTRHRFTARRVSVAQVRDVGGFVRVTLAGDDLHDFASLGPADHCKVFFPDPATGELVAPTAAPDGEEGIVRPGRPAFGRDFTPLNVRGAGAERTFELDLLRHSIIDGQEAAPATTWAARAAIGDELVVVGPRGSAAAAIRAPGLVCVVDESALPAASRWLSDMPTSSSIEVVLDTLPENQAWARDYLLNEGGREVPMLLADREPFGLVEACRELIIDEATYVFAAGEAGRLVPLRRYLRRELGLPAEQLSVQGYWREGDRDFDHHAPLDPNDPDDESGGV